MTLRRLELELLRHGLAARSSRRGAALLVARIPLARRRRGTRPSAPRLLGGLGDFAGATAAASASTAAASCGGPRPAHAALLAVCRGPCRHRRRRRVVARPLGDLAEGAPRRLEQCPAHAPQAPKGGACVFAQLFPDALWLARAKARRGWAPRAIAPQKARVPGQRSAQAVVLCEGVSLDARSDFRIQSQVPGDAGTGATHVCIVRLLVIRLKLLPSKCTSPPPPASRQTSLISPVITHTKRPKRIRY